MRSFWVRGPCNCPGHTPEKPALCIWLHVVTAGTMPYSSPFYPQGCISVSEGKRHSMCKLNHLRRVYLMLWGLWCPGQSFLAKWDNAAPGRAEEPSFSTSGQGTETVTRKLRGELHGEGILTGTVAFVREMPGSQPLNTQQGRQPRTKYSAPTFLPCSLWHRKPQGDGAYWWSSWKSASWCWEQRRER